MISLDTLRSYINIPDYFPNHEIRGIALDSRKVQKDFLFAALPGNQLDGQAFIQQAIENGANTILLTNGSNMDLPSQCVPIYCDNPRQVIAKITSLFYPKLPHHKIAVTGTNGKTSTVDFARQLWELENLKSASIGTLGVLNNAGYHYTGPVLTTPDTIILHEIMQNLAKKHVTHVAMEASSHGLAQYRLDNIELEAAAFTNLTRDHLDYHHSFEAYFQAKQRLFTDILPSNAIAALNSDMNASVLETLLNIIKKRKQQLRLVGIKGNFLRLNHVKPLPHGQEITYKTASGNRVTTTLSLLGRYQIDNILLSMALIAKDSEHLESLVPLLPKLKGVKGRMEQAAFLPNGATVYVDYAHTPDALTHLLQSLRPHVHHELYIIFGAGGNRDKGKRPLMALEAGKYADHVIITDDNPRHENPALIRNEIKKGFPRAVEIAGREEAIAQTVKKLQPGDILVIAGKGHEQGQIIGNIIHPFDDVKIVQKYMRYL